MSWDERTKSFDVGKYMTFESDKKSYIITIMLTDNTGAQSDEISFGLYIDGPSTAEKQAYKKRLEAKRKHTVPVASIIDVTKRGIVTIDWSLEMRIPKNLTYVEEEEI